MLTGPVPSQLVILLLMPSLQFKKVTVCPVWERGSVENLQKYHLSKHRLSLGFRHQTVQMESIEKCSHHYKTGKPLVELSLLDDASIGVFL